MSITGVLAARALWTRLQLSRAKHPSLQGHARIARRLARLIPFYEFGGDRFFDSDDAPREVADRRRAGFDRLAAELRARAPDTVAFAERLEPGVSDLQFTSTHRVPFQYARHVKAHLPAGGAAVEASGVCIRDLDGNEAYDLTGSYGVNVFGHDFYKSCIEAGARRVAALGPLLGTLHPVIEENVRLLREVSGLDEVSFHMSGTEAVMQAVRLARYHTRRSHVVQFCGAYHGWWDGVQPGLGNPRATRDVYVLKDMDAATLRVLRTRRDIACVLVNPLQALHPNAGAPADASLVSSTRRAGFDRAAYAAWLRQVREVCSARGIVLVFDEVFAGFRLAYGGAQEYFGVTADIVTYGKTVGGGLPVGVVCGRRELMKRYREERPLDVCFARGTFNSHPYVMGAMNEFLRRVSAPGLRRTYEGLDATWNARAEALNDRLARDGLPVRVANLASIWTICYTTPSRYNWMFQFYLRARGLVLSWVGSGRLVFSHNFTDADVAQVTNRFVAAARAMEQDGWWWHTPALTNAAIHRRMLREVLGVLASRRPRARAGRHWNPAEGKGPVPSA